MNNEKFKAIFPYIISDLYSKAATEFSLSEEDTIEKVTNSKVFEYLEREETKFWHYSTEKLFSLLIDEMNGKFEMPLY